jgi:hypothetical protein
MGRLKRAYLMSTAQASANRAPRPLAAQLWAPCRRFYRSLPPAHLLSYRRPRAQAARDALKHPDERDRGHRPRAVWSANSRPMPHLDARHTTNINPIPIAAFANHQQSFCLSQQLEGGGSCPLTLTGNMAKGRNREFTHVRGKRRGVFYF